MEQPGVAEDSGVVRVRLSETTRQPRQLKEDGYEHESPSILLVQVGPAFWRWR